MEINKQITNMTIMLEEIKTTIKKNDKTQSLGIDGISAELYQIFDYITEWIFSAKIILIERKWLTDVMRATIVKLLHTKNEKHW